jgi:protocatechuate 3,4-dioxygenase alpha subunit
LADINCRKFSDILATKADHYPYSDHFVSAVQDLSGAPAQTERERTIKCFRAYEAKSLDSYRPQSPSQSACRCYNSLTNAGSLLWVAEAVGINELTVRQAYEAALAAGDEQHACGAIRKIITWDMIYALT